MKPSEVLRRAKQRCLGPGVWDFDAAMVIGTPDGAAAIAYRHFSRVVRPDFPRTDAQLKDAFDRAIALAEQEEAG